MWLVVNRTPYVADRTWLQDKDARKIWLVIVKATFDILPDGSTRLAEQQVPILRMGVPSGELGHSSLIYEADTFGLKTGTDLLVNGRAWAQRGRRAAATDVQVSLGPIRKHLRVFGDRIWDRGVVGGLSISDPEPFESMPIVFERGFGGWDRAASDPGEHRLESRNPVGTGFALRAEHCVGMRLPNVEHADQLIESWKDRPAPAGLTPIDCSWSPRRELAGTYDERWLSDRSPLWAEDFDPRYNSCAPADQQVRGFLEGGEAAQLVNLSPDGQLAFRLPKVNLSFNTQFGRNRVEHGGQLCTVIVEPDVPRVVMVWQASLVCNDRVDELDATFVAESSSVLAT